MDTPPTSSPFGPPTKYEVGIQSDDLGICTQCGVHFQADRPRRWAMPDECETCSYMKLMHGDMAGLALYLHRCGAPRQEIRNFFLGKPVRGFAEITRMLEHDASPPNALVRRSRAKDMSPIEFILDDLFSFPKSCWEDYASVFVTRALDRHWKRNLPYAEVYHSGYDKWHAIARDLRLTPSLMQAFGVQPDVLVETARDAWKHPLPRGDADYERLADHMEMLAISVCYLRAPAQPGKARFAITHEMLGDIAEKNGWHGEHYDFPDLPYSFPDSFKDDDQFFASEHIDLRPKNAESPQGSKAVPAKSTQPNLPNQRPEGLETADSDEQTTARESD